MVTRALELLKRIVVTEGEDKGVVLLDHESSTHWDPVAQCETYDREYFSPLGDALIELYEMLEELT